MNQNKPELLSPAGSRDSLIAAINAGADAIYLAGNQFGARAYAHNFDKDELIDAIELAHLYEKKVYLTVNTLLKNEEINQLYDYILPYYEAGLDAVIVQDSGVMKQLRLCFPMLPIHASTQMTVTAAEGVRLLDDYYVKRVVLARELSIGEIIEIKNHSKAELEVFVHGALCYCYSGKCLLSSMIGGRSGNRGRCAQPCRLPYDFYKNQQKQNKKDEQYLLSTKDICTINQLPELIKAGVDSFKIEGRMKRPEYVAGVTHYYRMAIDAFFDSLEQHTAYQLKQKDVKDLISIYCRGGSNESYLNRQNGRDMITKTPPSYETGNERLFESISETYLVNPEKLSVDATVTIQMGEKCILELECQGKRVRIEGVVAEAAQKQPLTKDMLEKQLRKTGNTPFVIKQMNCVISNDIYVTIRDLNELRRLALNQLKEQLLEDKRRKFVNKPDSTHSNLDNHQLKGKVKNQIGAIVKTLEQLQVLIEFNKNEINKICIDMSEDIELLTALEACQKACFSNVYVTLPDICRENKRKLWEKKLVLIQKYNVKGILIRNFESLQFLKEQNYVEEIIADTSLYCMNDQAKGCIQDLGCCSTIMPLELNERELWNLDRTQSDLLIYGYFPVMHSAQCLLKTTGQCVNGKHDSMLFLKDRAKKNLHVIANCKLCYNTIYNSVPLSLHTELDKLKKMEFQTLWMSFTFEDKTETKELIHYFLAKKRSADPVLPNVLSDYTKGHFSRGVE